MTQRWFCRTNFAAAYWNMREGLTPSICACRVASITLAKQLLRFFDLR